MTQTYEEYLKHVAEYGDTFSIQKKDLPELKMKLGGPNGNWIYLKKCILLNYGNSEDESIIYIEDNTDNKQLINFSSEVFSISLLITVNAINLSSFPSFNILSANNFLFGNFSLFISNN